MIFPFSVRVNHQCAVAGHAVDITGLAHLLPFDLIVQGGQGLALKFGIFIGFIKIAAGDNNPVPFGAVAESDNFFARFGLIRQFIGPGIDGVKDFTRLRFLCLPDQVTDEIAAAVVLDMVNVFTLTGGVNGQQAVIGYGI